MTPQTALGHPHKAPKEVKRIFDEVEGRDQRVELNLYVSGYEDDEPSSSRDEDASLADAPEPPRRKARPHESGLLARLREPRVHAGAARIDGRGRATARHRADRARPRGVLRRRRDRRAQPGAGRHAQRAHVRAGPADRRRADDEHLLDLPGRPVGVPAAARRQHRVPRADQREPDRGGPSLREGPQQ